MFGTEGVRKEYVQPFAKSAMCVSETCAKKPQAARRDVNSDFAKGVRPPYPHQPSKSCKLGYSNLYPLTTLWMFAK